jgi:hypothetical protein
MKYRICRSRKIRKSRMKGRTEKRRRKENNSMRKQKEKD